jgi:type I restriction enzyme S subunit
MRKYQDYRFMMKNSKEQKTALPELRFPEFRDSEGWTQKIVSNVLNNQSSSLALNKLEFTEVGYPVYGADSDKIIGLISYYTQNEDYISIVKDGSGVGRLALRQKQTSVLGTLNCLTSTEKRRYILSWLYYMMQTIDLTNYVKGSGIPHIYYADYKKHTIFIPTPREQTKIAECFSSLDDLISAVTDKIEVLKEHKKGLMQQLFPAEGKTTPTLRFPEFQNAPAWKPKSLGSIGEIITGNTPATKEQSNYGGDRLFVSPADISNERYVSKTKTTLTEQGFSQSRCIKENSILFVCIGSTIGKIAQNTIECATNQQINSIVPYAGYISDFVYSLLEYNASKIASTASNQAVPIINKTEFSAVTLFMPKEDEQQAIADCLSSIDDQITAETQKLDQLKAHKKGLMQRLFPKV